jgi:hypothetical protein
MFRILSVLGFFLISHVLISCGRLQAQVVCCVIETLPCEVFSEVKCTDSWCFPGPDEMFLCPAAVKENKRLDNSYQGTRPADPAEAGFFFFTLTTPVKCAAERTCTGCSDVYWVFGVFVADCLPPEGNGGWVDIGPTYWTLTGSSPCCG